MAKNSEYFIKYDTKAINRDIPIERVLETYLGIHVNGRKPIHCPKPEHVDRKPSATVYHNTNTCRCFSCNTSFSPIDIAQINMPNMPFLELMEKICNDFGLDPYRYSNLAEIEDKMQNSKSSEKKFYEHFPLEDDELDVIGLQTKPTKAGIEMTVEQYERLSCGEEYVVKAKEKDPSTYNDKDGKPSTCFVSFSELAEMGYPHFTSNDRELYTPTIRNEWEQAIREGDKDYRDECENIIRNCAYSAIEQYNETINYCKDVMNGLKKVFPNNDAVLEAKKWADGYVKAVQFDHITPVLSSSQSEKIQNFYTYSNCSVMLNKANEGLNLAETVLSKLDKYQFEREQAEKQNVKKYNVNR